MGQYMDVSAAFAGTCLARLRDEGVLQDTSRAHVYRVVKRTVGAPGGAGRGCCRTRHAPTCTGWSGGRWVHLGGRGGTGRD